jgi:hypothetical protein
MYITSKYYHGQAIAVASFLLEDYTVLGYSRDLAEMPTKSPPASCLPPPVQVNALNHVFQRVPLFHPLEP